MSSLTPILHSGVVNGKPLRFVPSPLTGPDFPWHVADDLFAALAFPRAVRREFSRKLKAEHAKDVKTVATAAGIVTIAPHFMAQGAIGAAVDIGCAPRSVEGEYGREGVKALNKFLDPRGIKDMDAVAYAIDAARRA